MRVYLNHTPIELASGATICDLLSHEGIPAEGTAIAIESKVVPRSEWATYILREEIHLTLIRATCGG